jgi:hypothetical protein
MNNDEVVLVILGLAVPFYALAMLVWTIVLLKRWLQNHSRPPATITNLFFGWPVYFLSVFAGLLRRVAKAPRQALGITCAAALCAVLLYPPWEIYRSSNVQAVIPVRVERAFLLSGPSRASLLDRYYTLGARVRISQLALEVATIAVAGLFIFLGLPKNKP